MLKATVPAEGQWCRSAAPLSVRTVLKRDGRFAKLRLVARDVDLTRLVSCSGCPRLTYFAPACQP